MSAPAEPDWGDQASPYWCAYHCVIEEPYEFGPICGECWHRFKSADDLLAQDIRVRRELGQTDGFPTSIDEVFCCPFCTHDF
jgi:hypothetical protein